MNHIESLKRKIFEGGPSSGNYGHAGRPGQVGGSAEWGDKEVDVEVYFHGTDATSIKDIVREGIIPGGKSGRKRIHNAAFYNGPRSDAVFVVKTIDEARTWAIDAVGGRKIGKATPSIVIFKVRIPKSIETIQDVAAGGSAAYIRSSIKPAWIESATAGKLKVDLEHEYCWDYYWDSGTEIKLNIEKLRSAKNEEEEDNIFYVPIIFGFSKEKFESLLQKKKTLSEGSSTSGNFGHAGRPGEVGGSGEGRGTGSDKQKKWHGLKVDAELKDEWMSKLNRLPGVNVISMCAGHRDPSKSAGGTKSPGINFTVRNDEDKAMKVKDSLSDEKTKVDVNVWAGPYGNWVVRTNGKDRLDVFSKSDIDKYPIDHVSVSIDSTIENKLGNEKDIDDWWDDTLKKLDKEFGVEVKEQVQEGSSTSGNFGHAGRPGQVGGSGEGGGKYLRKRSADFLIRRSQRISKLLTTYRVRSAVRAGAQAKTETIVEGSASSGNYGHAGRAGKIGGSAKGSQDVSKADQKDSKGGGGGGRGKIELQDFDKNDIPGTLRKVYSNYSVSDSEKFIFLTNDGKMMVIGGDKYQVSLSLSDIIDNLKNNGKDISQLSAIIHNHNKGQSFSLTDRNAYKKLQKAGFTGKFQVYYPKIQRITTLKALKLKKESVIDSLKRKILEGGPSSGNFGHSGRSGEVGGSAEGGNGEGNKVAEPGGEKATTTYEPESEKGYGNLISSRGKVKNISKLKQRIEESLGSCPKRDLENLNGLIIHSNDHWINAVGDYQEAFITTAFYEKSTRTIKMPTRMSTSSCVMHEVGHHVWHQKFSVFDGMRFSQLFRDAGKIGLKFPTQYSRKNSRELFAESYARYHTKKKLDNRIKEFFDNYYSKKTEQVTEGGPTSGNFGHSGRPGEVGGSASDGISDGVIQKDVVANTIKNKCEKDRIRIIDIKWKKNPFNKDKMDLHVTYPRTTEHESVARIVRNLYPDSRRADIGDKVYPKGHPMQTSPSSYFGKDFYQFSIFDFGKYEKKKESVLDSLKRKIEKRVK